MVLADRPVLVQGLAACVGRPVVRQALAHEVVLDARDLLAWPDQALLAEHPRGHVPVGTGLVVEGQMRGRDAGSRLVLHEEDLARPRVAIHPVERSDVSHERLALAVGQTVDPRVGDEESERLLRGDDVPVFVLAVVIDVPLHHRDAELLGLDELRSILVVLGRDVALLVGAEVLPGVSRVRATLLALLVPLGQSDVDPLAEPERVRVPLGGQPLVGGPLPLLGALLEGAALRRPQHLDGGHTVPAPRWRGRDGRCDVHPSDCLG